MPLITFGAVLGLVIFTFSLYRLFISQNSMDLGVNLLRVILALLGTTAVLFSESIVLATSVLMFALISILVMSVVRNEVQIKND
jgi:hypothetical protein